MICRNAAKHPARVWRALILLNLLGACLPSPSGFMLGEPDSAGSVDGSQDGGATDASAEDAMVEPDATMDAQPDIGLIDASVDAPIDVSPDAPMDAAVDIGIDADGDGGNDAGLDAGSDAGPTDAGPCVAQAWTAHDLSETEEVAFGERSVAFAVDQAGGQHLAFIGRDLMFRPILRYGRRVLGGLWTFETVDDETMLGQYIAIAASSAGQPHIVYLDDSGSLHHSSKTGTSWTASSVDDFVGSRRPAIVVDSANTPNVVFATSNGLYHGVPAGPSSWTLTRIDSPSARVGANRLSAVYESGANIIHVAFRNTIDDGLGYARRVAGTWETMLVDPTPLTGTQTSITLDLAAGVHIAYQGGDNQDVRHAYLMSGGSETDWVGGALYNAQRAGDALAIAVDAAFGIHIAFRVQTLFEVIHAYGAPSPVPWELSTIDSANGFPVGGVIDDDGRLTFVGSGVQMIGGDVVRVYESRHCP